MQGLGAVLGSIGFFLGLFNVFWAMWSYYNQRRERIEAYAELYVGGSLNSRLLSVYLYNVSRIPVYIKEVVLARGQGAKQRNFPLVMEHAATDPLQPGEGRRYLLARLSGDELQDLHEAAEKDLQVTIRSPARHLFRIKGKDLDPLLDEIVRESGERLAS